MISSESLWRWVCDSTAREGYLAEGDHSWDGVVRVRVSLDLDVAGYNYPRLRLQRSYASPVLL